MDKKYKSKKLSPNSMEIIGSKMYLCNMLNSFRNKIGNYLLKRESATIERNLKMVNLSNAKSIGIVYPLFDVPDYNHVMEFVTQLQHARKEVKVLGFVQEKNLVNRFLPKLSYDFFSQHNLNWFNKPVNERVQDFIAREFDLLIDLTIQEHLPIKYVVGLSKARCKVGRFSDDNARYYDLMIKIQPMTAFREFISQVKHYLTIIKTDE